MSTSRLFGPAIVLWLLSPAVAAQGPNTVTRESTMTAVVDRIERPGRVVIFRDPGNVIQSVYVDPSVTIFDDLKVGDIVTVRYIESVIVQLRPGAKPTEIRDSTEAARKDQGGQVVQQLKAVVTVESVDDKGPFVTFRTHDNRRVIRAVSDRRLLDGVGPGDRIEVTFTRERAVSIERGGR